MKHMKPLELRLDAPLADGFQLFPVADQWSELLPARMPLRYAVFRYLGFYVATTKSGKTSVCKSRQVGAVCVTIRNDHKVIFCDRVQTCFRNGVFYVQDLHFENAGVHTVTVTVDGAIASQVAPLVLQTEVYEFMELDECPELATGVYAPLPLRMMCINALEFVTIKCHSYRQSIVKRKPSCSMTNVVMDSSSTSPLFLGLDCSTQSMSAVVTDASGAAVFECAFRFDDRLPVYGTTNGVVRSRDAADREVVLIPSLLFVDALDAIFTDLAASDAVDLSRVAAISGSAQQHASVFWSKGFALRARMEAAEPQTPLVDVLLRRDSGSANEHTAPFYYALGPSWMDSSTTEFCRALEHAVGGAQRVAAISGSRAYERFTGNQIAKRLHDDAAFLDSVERIALVSSLLTSVLCGDFTPIDESDGSGMNLLDVQTRTWSSELVAATASQSVGDRAQAAKRLEAALGSAVAKPYRSAGVVHPYFQRKFGLSRDCAVVPFSGDNPCTLAGIGLALAGDVGVSLGTSSTLMAVVPTAEARFSGDEGHIFSNPIDPDSLMDVRDRCASGSWSEFESLLASTAPGNSGTCAFYFSDPEITPATHGAGVVAFSASDEQVDAHALPREVEVRAVVESQFLAMRLHAERLGVTQPKRLIAVGGASSNAQMLQVLADVFNAPVYRLARAAANSAALGGALRAQHALVCDEAAARGDRRGFVPFERRASQEIALAARPEPAATAVYSRALARFEALEARVVEHLCCGSKECLHE